MNVNRVILIVLDSVGIGALPDASEFGDEGSNTLGHISELYPSLHIPNLVEMGLGNIDPNNGIAKTSHPTAAYGKASEQSKGKDTTTGHWEMAGTIIKESFPTFPDGFPTDFIKNFEEKIGIEVIGNCVASGTSIINELGDIHVKTKKPIVYTSADSVFQIALHEEVYPIERQYEICETARKLLIGELSVGRVIARPFVGKNSNYERTANRKDFSRTPPFNVLNAIVESGKEVIAIGKVVDIFAGMGISGYSKTANNEEGIDKTIAELKKESEGLIFTNLVDFDMLYGHRRDVLGYGQCLEAFDRRLKSILENLKNDDLLIITADHGNDPSFKGTDHTREYIPILCFGENIHSSDFGIRNSFADISQTIAEALSIQYQGDGESFYASMLKL